MVLHPFSPKTVEKKAPTKSPTNYISHGLCNFLDFSAMISKEEETSRITQLLPSKMLLQSLVEGHETKKRSSDTLIELLKNNSFFASSRVSILWSHTSFLYPHVILELGTQALFKTAPKNKVQGRMQQQLINWESSSNTLSLYFLSVLSRKHSSQRLEEYSKILHKTPIVQKIEPKLGRREGIFPNYSGYFQAWNYECNPWHSNSSWAYKT